MRRSLSLELDITWEVNESMGETWWNTIGQAPAAPALSAAPHFEGPEGPTHLAIFEDRLCWTRKTWAQRVAPSTWRRGAFVWRETLPLAQSCVRLLGVLEEAQLVGVPPQSPQHSNLIQSHPISTSQHSVVLSVLSVLSAFHCGFVQQFLSSQVSVTRKSCTRGICLLGWRSRVCPGRVSYSPSETREKTTWNDLKWLVRAGDQPVKKWPNLVFCGRHHHLILHLHL